MKWTYDDCPHPLQPVQSFSSFTEWKKLLDENSKYYQDKAILCPKNVDVDEMNEQLMTTMLPGEEKLYYSADAVSAGDHNGLYVTTEFLNDITLSGLPPHVLRVKIGAVMMLLRNLNPKHGLCNGTRIVVTKLGSRVIEGVILTGRW